MQPAFRVPRSEFRVPSPDARTRASQPETRNPKPETSLARNSNRPVSGQIFTPRLGKEVRFEDWYWKELREGGMLNRYLAKEKFLSTRRLRAVAIAGDRKDRAIAPVNSNRKSEFRCVAEVPAREYFRWKAVDPHFWEDKANLKSFKRDNPDARIFT